MKMSTPIIAKVPKWARREVSHYQKTGLISSALPPERLTREVSQEEDLDEIEQQIRQFERADESEIDRMRGKGQVKLDLDGTPATYRYSGPAKNREFLFRAHDEEMDTVAYGRKTPNSLDFIQLIDEADEDAIQVVSVHIDKDDPTESTVARKTLDKRVISPGPVKFPISDEQRADPTFQLAQELIQESFPSTSTSSCPTMKVRVTVFIMA